jgi:uncharacterized protein YyaL (SSP411 family)
MTRHANAQPRFTNALIDSTSPYLLQHAHNPVDWKPWGKPAFTEAHQRDVPIFLSIGYSTCYWCHVMEREVFENSAIAERLNAACVCIKVDREERPDVDDLYMSATQLLTGSGGWPMSVFLTPPGVGGDGEKGLKPFWAGTYIPPTRMHGRPGFVEVVEAISGFWRDERQQVLDQAERVASAVAEQSSAKFAAGPVTSAMIDRVSQGLMTRYDPRYGGFSGSEGPKFPTPVQPMFLLSHHENESESSAIQALHHTLSAIARGGIFDQVGGGFHRYSVDERWLVPHFEKMLYDNGQLLELFASAIRADPQHPNVALYRRVITETSEYLKREMTDPTGAFWSAQDAEVNTREGENYLWDKDEFEQVLKAGGMDDGAVAILADLYGLESGPNFRDPHHAEAQPTNVLYLPRPMDEVANVHEISVESLDELRQSAKRILLAHRDRRDQPATDDKVLTAWNGSAIAGLAKAGIAIKQRGLIDIASRAADAVLEHMVDDEGRVLRSMRQGKIGKLGFLEDAALLIHGLLALHQAETALQIKSTGRYLDQAIRLTNKTADDFGRPDAAGTYFDTRQGQSDLFVQGMSIQDGAMPSGNAQMLHNAITLAELTHEKRWMDLAIAGLRRLSQPLQAIGLGMTHTAHAASRLLRSGRMDVVEVLNNSAELTSTAAVEQHSRAVAATAEKTRGASGGSSEAYRIEVVIPDGLHLYANPIDEPGLVATTLTANVPLTRVDYPPGQLKSFGMADAVVPIYEGQVVITVETEQPATRFMLKFQPCNDQACFEVTELYIAVEDESSSRVR